LATVFGTFTRRHDFLARQVNMRAKSDLGWTSEFIGQDDAGGGNLRKG
jgi:hypothetical protein